MNEQHSNGTKAILELIEIVEVKGTLMFIVEEKFRENEMIDGVSITWLGDDFRRGFLGKKEENVTSAKLRIHQPHTDDAYALAREELGDLAATHLANLWELLKKQGTGEKGSLLAHDFPNFIYAHDVNGGLCRVYAVWHPGATGWCINSLPLELRPNGIRGGQIISR